MSYICRYCGQTEEDDTEMCECEKERMLVDEERRKEAEDAEQELERILADLGVLNVY